MPNLYDRSYNPYTKDGDDCPPHPFSMAYGGNEPADEERSAWDFVKVPSKKTKRAIEQTDQIFQAYQAREQNELESFSFFSIPRQTEKAWLIRFSSGKETWFPKSLCTVFENVKQIAGPYSFMRKKMQEIHSKGPTPVIGIKLAVCPYCGKDTGCDCASPGHREKTTLIPERPANLDAEVAKWKLRKFVEENK